MYYYQHHIGDYRKDTAHLTLLEHGIYRQLLDLYYINERPLSLDHATNMRLVCVRNADESKAYENVINDFFCAKDDGFHHKRCDEEIDRFTTKSEKARHSANKRWGVDANNMRTHSEGNANVMLTDNQEPLTINQIVKANAICDAKPACTCPHQEIINLYHELLPTCPKVKEWTPARKSKLKARWNENEKRQNLEYWGRLFEYIGQSDFLMSRTAKPFYGLNLEWIVTQSNFTKIIERNYENR
jgi:uncharacterized protein YdaU (DUF1376 family)